MTQLTSGEARRLIDAICRVYGDDVPLWMAHQDCGVPLPAWAQEPTLVPVADLYLSESAGGAAVVVVALGSERPEAAASLHLDLDPEALSALVCLYCGEDDCEASCTGAREAMQAALRTFEAARREQGGATRRGEGRADPD